MGLLRTPRIPPHQLSVQETGQRTRLLGHHGRELQCAGQDIFLLLEHFLEQAAEVFRVAGKDVAGGDEIHGVRVADQARQEEGGIRLHGDAAARKDEAVLGGRVRDADGRGQGHGQAETDGGAVEGDDRGLAAPVHGEVQAAATLLYSVSLSVRWHSPSYAGNMVAGEVSNGIQGKTQIH